MEAVRTALAASVRLLMSELAKPNSNTPGQLTSNLERIADAVAVAADSAARGAEESHQDAFEGGKTSTFCFCDGKSV